MHRLIALSLLTLVASLSLAQDKPKVEPWVCPPGFEGQTLHVFNWSSYIAPNTIGDFEAACGVTIVYSVYDSNETMLAKLVRGNPGYDIAVPSGSAVGRMIQLDLLEPLDLDKLPQLATISSDLLNPPYDPGNVYSVPYQWGTTGIGYNRKKVTQPISSWDDLWNYQGKVAWLGDMRGMMGIALHLLGFSPDTTDPDEITAARDFLLSKGDNVAIIATGDGQIMLERGDVDMVIGYNGSIIALKYSCECDDFAYVVPQEGSFIWVDNLVIPRGAPNPELAHVFIDYILHPQTNADISNFTAYGSPNQVAIDAGLIDEALLANEGIYPPPAIREKLFFIGPVPNQVDVLYSDAWDEVAILLSR
ncbi:MAG: spermidine/putrescine ABC transporter substrate-binding protein [Anaerolineae bacterium]|nr:spermidine/putrescine ABC transporter substrate-binding protein [Anaerolineae bacterium]MDW8171832.1 spermidine/putrescine ABC transporter substrate-binding protein [Anaerolineae bacterium]